MKGLDEAESEVRTVLRSLRRTPFRSDDPFGVVGAEAIQSLWRSISAGAFAVMMLVSGISLVVGAIVIANIMFVSVVERTTEIGVRRALGARRRDIKRQFLARGGRPRHARGRRGGDRRGARLARGQPGLSGQVQLRYVLLGLVISTLTGVLAGLAPASAAARLTPIEALRYE